MKRNVMMLTASLSCVMVGALVAGCGHNDKQSSDALAQQKSGIMGGPPPASALAKIAADRAAQAGKTRTGMQEAQRAGATKAQNK